MLPLDEATEDTAEAAGVTGRRVEARDNEGVGIPGVEGV